MNGFGNQKRSKKNIHKKFNNSEEQIINQALILHSQGKIKEAERYYKYFINQGHKDYRIFTNYGCILTNLGKFKEAELLTRKAIELNPRHADAYLNLGSILNNLGKFQEAELSARKAIELNPKRQEAYSNLGTILVKLEKIQDAEKSIRKAIELEPQNPVAYLTLGSILYKLREYEQAELSTRKAIELKPKNGKAYSNLGIILCNLDKLQEAELSIRKAIELEPNFIDSYHNLGEIMFKQGKSQEAESSFLKAIELNPQLGISYYHLSNFYNKQKLYDKALIAINKAYEYDHTNHLIQGEFTRLNFILGKYDEEVPKDNPWSNSDDYFYEENNSDILLISFGSNGRDGKLIPSFNFHNLLKNNKSFDKLFLRDIDRNYYLTGLKNTTTNLKETIDLIKKLSSVKNYKKIVSIGSSAGGFAAILFGQLLNFSKVIAFNPQTVISEEKELIINDFFYTVDICKKLRNLNPTDTLYQKCLNLKNLVPFKTKVDIHFSNLSEVDKNHANFIKHKNCNLIKYESSSHLLALQLRENEKLKDIIEESLL